ncbi:AAA family ATPase [Methylobacterium aquaticum]|uniref:AAA family ATPase n=1 Tax=Methylobacterium aquaticum TaxID=270351 RepID=UPI0011AEAC23|nr:AAA family ATPase [Methylobacterium aquaticum]
MLPGIVMSQFFRKRFTPDEVFTPRSPSVNQEMYVKRTDLEKSLINALRGSKNIIVSGESGSGKTWLYKKVFESEEITYESINLSNASLKGSLDAAFKDKNDRLGGRSVVEVTRTGASRFTPSGVGLEKSGSERSAIGQKGPFETLLSHIRLKAGRKGAAILVYENFEQIVDNESIIKSISDTIILLDDDDLSLYKVKLCLVGVPTDIKQYLSKASRNITTIANRIVEIPEVARLSAEEATSLMRKGFEEKLKYKFDCDRNAFYQQACWKSDRIAQHVHEYSLSVAHAASENGGAINEDIISKAETEWLSQTLSADYAAIESRMNARDTKAGRRNQILYSLGQCDTENFKYTDIEKIVRTEFSKSTKDVGLNIAGNLTELSDGDRPIIRRTPKGDAYRFTSPKYRMCLRTMLKKTTDERVEKISQIDL